MTGQYSQKWAIAAFFDEFPIDFTFHRTEISLHATLAGVFAIDKNRDEINSLLKEYLIQFKPFEVTGGDIVTWGEIQVTLLQYSDEFDALYRGIQQMLLGNGAEFNETEYLGDGFTPHVTVQKTEEHAPGESRRVWCVSIVDMFPGGDFEQRLIAGNVELAS